MTRPLPHRDHQTVASPESMFPAQGVRRLRARLLHWYDRHRRDLPWRVPLAARNGLNTRNGRTSPDAPAAPNPYHVLVSEAMLQQTQVATVVPYFERFIARFPTVADLASADEQAVLTLWQGLGYYRRARHLHAAAKRIVEHHAGCVPESLDELRALPGVGRYAAGAIASIAFNRPAAILDGNVARVLSRWCAIDEPIDLPATRDRLWKLAERLVPRGPRARPGDLNQALMELGATLCTPRAPRCDACPVRAMCRAHQLGLADALPARRARRAPKPVTHHVAAISRRGAYLFEQRGPQSLWANMWQFPTHEPPASDPNTALNARHVSEWVESRLHLSVEPTGETHAFTHQTTHRTIRFVVHPLRATAGRLPRGAGVWRRLDALDDLPLANPQRQIVAHLSGKRTRR